MAGSEYYDDRYCEHGNNVGFYGSGCYQCERERERRLQLMRWSDQFRSLLLRLAEAHPDAEEFGVYAKTRQGVVRVRGTKP